MRSARGLRFQKRFSMIHDGIWGPGPSDINSQHEVFAVSENLVHGFHVSSFLGKLQRALKPHEEPTPPHPLLSRTLCTSDPNCTKVVKLRAKIGPKLGRTTHPSTLALIRYKVACEWMKGHSGLGEMHSRCVSLRAL